MDYKQYTSCVEAKSHSTMNQYIQATIQALVAGGIGALIVGAAAMPWCLLIVGEIMAIMWLLGYCHWWLEDRLVCLGGDRVAIGMLVSVEPPQNKTGLDRLDTDYSLNLLLPPNPIGADQATVEASVPYGELVKEQTSTKGAGLPFTGEQATEPASGKVTAILHAEFEGAGVSDTLLGAQIALAIAVAALIACLAIPGPIGAIIAAILAILALLAALIGGAVGLGDTGSPGDVNPSLGDLHTNDPGTMVGADLLVVMGRWVYDAGHNNQGRGWNELHPIKLCERIGTWGGDWPADIGVLETRWADAVGSAASPLTAAGQKRPENRWQIHPVVDGCQPGTPPPPPPPPPPPIH
jgi:hypothetical protein